jgi:hypothetical protein
LHAHGQKTGNESTGGSLLRYHDIFDGTAQSHPAEVPEVLIEAASAAGGGRMQRMARKHVGLETFTHGSSARRAECCEGALRPAISPNVIVLREDDPGTAGTVIRKAHEDDGR